MPSKEQILKVIAGEEEPIHRNKIAEKLGENTYRSFQTQLDRFEKQGLIEGDPDHRYQITEQGTKELSDISIVGYETNEETLGTTEFQQFIHLGKTTGVSPPELILQTAEHIWNGGEYQDLDWVAKAFQQMGIRQDLRNRWWHSWRSYLRQPIPSRLPEAIIEKSSETSGSKKTKDDKDEDETRDYILDGNTPVYVGKGLGDMTYKDAVDLAKISRGRSGREADAAQTPSSMAQEIVTLFGLFQEMMGNKAEGKSYLMTQGENGVQVEEIDSSKPTIINYPASGNNNKQRYLINNEGKLEEIPADQPIVIKQQAPAQAAGGPHYLVDNRTGQVTPVDPGQPIIIHAQPAQTQQPNYSPIQMNDKDGNPIILDLNTYIRLEEHKQKQERDQEMHEAKIGITQGFKDLITKAGSALTHMAEDK